MKRVKIGDVSFSKVVCGTNPFWGRSHFSEARDAEYRGRFTDEAIERSIQQCIRLGCDSIESSANERIISILTRLRRNNSASIRFIGSTRLDETSKMASHQQKLAFLIASRADICVVHAQYVDRPRKDASIAGLKQLVAQIHDAGLLAGISTHRVETIELCEEQNYGIDTYLFPLNLSGFVYPGFEGKDTVQDRVNIVRSVAKPFILMKTLAAGRIPPEEGLQFVAENSKPNDLICLSFGTEDEISESLKLVEKLF